MLVHRDMSSLVVALTLAVITSLIAWALSRALRGYLPSSRH
jgi:hypothetical protein